MQSPASARPTTLGRFEIRGQLGAGGAGVVYEAWDTERQTAVALKTLRKLTGNSLYRFKREFRSLQGIRHRNLIRLGELFVEDDAWFFTMELIRGETLREYLRLPARLYSGQTDSETTVTVMSKTDLAGDTLVHTLHEATEDEAPEGPYALNEPRLRDALPQLARVIHALHRADRVHGDIKPSNVLVETGGRMVLTDFGLVQETTPGGSSITEFAGTPAYMAPEQAGGDAGPAADWYAFGSMLYHALTGRLPYYANHPYQLLEKKQRFSPAPPRAIAPGVPEDLDRLCEDLLRIDPNRRPRGPEILERLGIASSSDLGMVDHHHTLTQTAPFVGRTQEMATLEQAYRHVADTQTPSTVVVEGESGVGKSELVRHFLVNLRDEPDAPVVLEGRCYERETVPFKAFDGIVDALSRFMIELSDAEAAVLLPRKAGLLPKLFPVLGRVECIATSPVEAATAEPREQRKRMFSALRELVERVAERHRLVLVIDDFQWADAESLALLGEILHPSQPLPLTLILTSRLESKITVGSEPDLDLVVGGRFERLSVGALTNEQARELLILTGAHLQDPDALIEEAQGHPLFLVELARHAATMQSMPGGGDRTARLDDALWSRARELDPSARHLLEILAVAGTPVSNAVAARALDTDYSDFEQAAALLRAASLARSNAARGTDSLETYHDRVRTAVSSRLADDDRKRCHARLAIAMETEKDSSDPRAFVRHLEEAGQREKAARRAAEFGKSASETFAFEQASALFASAIRLGNWSDDEARELRMMRGYALINAGLGSEAADEFLRAAQDADPATRLECRRHAAEQLLICGRIEPGLAAMSDLLAEVGAKLRKSQAKSLAALLWNRLCLRVRGLGWKNRHIREIADAELMRLEVYKAVAHGLGTVDSIVGFEFQARGLRLALKLGEKTRVARALFIEAIYLATQGTAGRARAEVLYKEARRIAQETQDPYLVGTGSVVRGCIEYFRGNFPSAVGPLRDGETRFRDVPGAVWELNGARMFLVFALRLMGKISELGPLYDELTRDADRRGDLHAGTTLRRAASIVWLARDDVDGARKALAHASWMPDTDVFHLQHWFELEANTDIALYEQSLENHRDALLLKFEALEKSLLRRVQTVRTTARWLRARVALTDAEAGRDQAASLALANKLAKSLAGEKIGYATVWSLLIRAGIAVQTDRLDKARSLLADAIDQADANHMITCGAAARMRLSALLGNGRGAALDDQARDLFAGENILAPERLLRVLAPGCAPRHALLENQPA